MKTLELKFTVDAVKSQLDELQVKLEDCTEVINGLYNDEIDSLSKCSSVLHKISRLCEVK